MKTVQSELKRLGYKKKKRKGKKDEKFWKEMMGTNRPTYEKRGGAWRQK